MQQVAARQLTTLFFQQRTSSEGFQFRAGLCEEMFAEIVEAVRADASGVKAIEETLRELRVPSFSGTTENCRRSGRPQNPT